MGSVFRAEDERLRREVALKVMKPGKLSTELREMFHDRFLREGQALASLSHPNVVQIFDAGEDGGTHFLVMELVDGPSLAERLERGPLPPEEVSQLGAQVADALAIAHERGILHRDLKPANLMQVAPGQWKLADFGIARLPGSNLTLTGQFLGTPGYSAPESIEEGSFSSASDIWGLGATLYAAACGAPPFGEHGLLTVAEIANQGPPTSLRARAPGVPKELEQTIMGMLAIDSTQRPSAAEVHAALRPGTSEPAPRPAPIAPRPASVAIPWMLVGSLLAVLLLLLFGAGAWFAWSQLRGDEDTRPPPAPIAPAPLDRQQQIEARWVAAQEALDYGDVPAAIDELEEIIRLDPYNPEAHDALDRLEATGY